jgi:hypothetical protein
MKDEKRNEELISAYIDGTLTDEEKRYVEETVLTDPVWHERFHQTRALRRKLQSLPQTPRGTSLWPAMAKRLGNDRDTEHTEIFPARLIPVVTVLAMIVVGLGSFMLTRNWDAVTDYFQDKRMMVEDIYEQGLVQGALQPLFAGLSNDDLIRFAFSGILSIPDGRGQGIKVDSDSVDRFELELTGTDQEKETPSLWQLYADLDVSQEQRNAIDSVLTDYRIFLESSAFIADRDEVAISPEIAGMDKFIIAAVAKQLMPQQRVSFNELLSRYAPRLRIPEEATLPAPPVFAFQAGGSTATGPGQVRIMPEHDISLRAPEPEATVSPVAEPRSRTFIVFKRDTVMSTEIQIPEMREFAAMKSEMVAERAELHREIAQAMKDIRIVINPDSVRVQVFTRSDHPDVSVHIGDRHPAVRRDSIYSFEFRPDYFVQLKELSRVLQKQNDVLNRYMPTVTEDDTLRIPEHMNTFHESFRKNMQQMEFDLERLQEELDKVLNDPRQFFVTPDSIFFRLFPDSLNQPK